MTKFREGDSVYWTDSRYRECQGIYLSQKGEYALVFESGFNRKVAIDRLRRFTEPTEIWNSWKA